jgi:D-serine deaminase-like pyridoxal phosphate-dependent protein
VTPLADTPALLLHLDVVEGNMASMAGRARDLGAPARVKT